MSAASVGSTKPRHQQLAASSSSSTRHSHSPAGQQPSHRTRHPPLGAAAAPSPAEPASHKLPPLWLPHPAPPGLLLPLTSRLAASPAKRGGQWLVLISRGDLPIMAHQRITSKAQSTPTWLLLVTLAHLAFSVRWWCWRWWCCRRCLSAAAGRWRRHQCGAAAAQPHSHACALHAHLLPASVGGITATARK